MIIQRVRKGVFLLLFFISNYHVVEHISFCCHDYVMTTILSKDHCLEVVFQVFCCAVCEHFVPNLVIPV